MINIVPPITNPKFNQSWQTLVETLVATTKTINTKHPEIQANLNLTSHNIFASTSVNPGTYSDHVMLGVFDRQPQTNHVHQPQIHVTARLARVHHKDKLRILITQHKSFQACYQTIVDNLIAQIKQQIPQDECAIIVEDYRKLPVN